MLNKVTNNNYRIRRNAQQSKLQTITTEYEEMLNKVTNNNYRIRRNAQQSYKQQLQNTKKTYNTSK